MKSFLVLFVALFGLASCLSLKQELAHRLTDCEAQLTKAIEAARNHSQNFHRSVYEALLTRVRENQVIVSHFRDNTTTEEIVEETNQIAALEIQTLSRFQNVDPHETAKAKAIYLAAIKEVSNYNQQFPAGQHLTDVIKIVEMETFMSENPKVTVDPNMRQNTMKYSLELEYTNLQRTMTNWKVPSFEDCYNLANQTRAKIVRYRQRSMIAEAERAEVLLAQFDELTRSLAREWPIDSKVTVEFYFSLAKLHYQTHVDLELLKPLEKTIKETLLDELDQQVAIINSAIDLSLHRSLSLWVERLKMVLDEVEAVRKNVNRLPDNADRNQALLMVAEVDALKNQVQFKIRNPAPDESTKARALYLAAMKSVDNDTSEATSGQLYNQVLVIVHKEEELARSFLSNPVMTLAEKLHTIANDPQIRSMFQVLQNMIGSAYIPSPNDDQELIHKGEKKMKELRNRKNPEKAEEMQSSVYGLADKTKTLNRLLPIYGKNRVDVWLANAKDHYKFAKEVERFLKQKN